MGYFLAFATDQYGSEDIRVFRLDSNGSPTETRTRGAGSGWAATGQVADRIMSSRMRIWEAEQDLLDAVGSMEVCQRCGGHIGATDDFDRCDCEAPTFWKSRRERRVEGEKDPDYDALADEGWDGMYGDVIRDLAVSVARVPDEKLTEGLFHRLIEHEAANRDSLADAHEDFEDFNRVWRAMLERIDRDPLEHLNAVRAQLATVRAEIVRQGGVAYAEGRNALSRREDSLFREALQVDENWDPIR